MINFSRIQNYQKCIFRISYVIKKMRMAYGETLLDRLHALPYGLRKIAIIDGCEMLFSAKWR
jgi:hypothetical protein